MGLNLLTRAQIINQGLHQGGNPGLSVLQSGETVSKAVRFFNSAMHHMFLVYDLPGIESTGSLVTTAGTETVSISGLTRFRSTRSIRVSGEDMELTPANNYSELWQKVELAKEQSTVQRGTPLEYFINPGRTAYLLHPIPDEAYTLKVVYYALPNIAAWDDSTTEFGFDDTLTMVSMMDFFAKHWDKNVTESVLIKGWMDQQFGQHRAAGEDVGRHKPATLKFNGDVWRRRR